jgi:hypothetical protein
MDMTPRKVEKKQMTAEAIYQADYRTAPVQQVQAITAQAPVIRKGFNAGQLNQNLGYGF